MLDVADDSQNSAMEGLAATVAGAAMPAADKSPRRMARALYWMGWRITDIAELLGVPRTTIHSWHKAEDWDRATAAARTEAALEHRIVQLIYKSDKTGGDYKEIDLLGRQMERLARIGKYSETGKESDLNPELAKRNAGPKKRPERNHFSPEQIERLREAFLDSNFGHQRNWWAQRKQRTRMILKSRQIGATFYFAREALLDAVLEAQNNQIFLSASKAQAHLFRSYAIQFAAEARANAVADDMETAVAGVRLSGDPMILSNGSELHFLGTNALTAQGYHGNFYFDEFFWTHRFDDLNKVASAMATHKRWRKTYFSTPSSIQHAAYKRWSGEYRNKGRAKEDRIALDLSHARLGGASGGFTGEDRVWRNIVTIHDALAGGCDLFDLDELLAEYNDEEFRNLFLCEFIDDSYSVFTLSELQRCMVDSWVDWHHLYKPLALRPVGQRAVWLGYDPSHTGDTAALVVALPPDKPGGKFRLLEKHQFKGLDFEAQAEFIRKVTERYNVTYMGIDTTGLGQGVYQLVQKFFPAARAIRYDLETKTRLVLKAKSVIGKGRLEFDAGWSDLSRAFLSIQRVLTASQRSTTFEAGRSEETSHADLAWAVMHILDNEPLEGGTETASQGFMEIA